MGAYFKPLRRKIGICTLLLACAFLATWVRFRLSSAVFVIEIPSAPLHHLFAAVPRGIAWKTERETHGATNILRFKRNIGWHRLSSDYSDWPSARLLKDSRSSYWCGIQFVEGYVPVPAGGELMERIFLIEYSIIVLPLTAMSAWLLLSEPRQSKASSPIQPAPETVA